MRMRAALHAEASSTAADEHRSYPISSSSISRARRTARRRHGADGHGARGIGRRDDRRRAARRSARRVEARAARRRRQHRGARRHRRATRTLGARPRADAADRRSGARPRSPPPIEPEEVTVGRSRCRRRCGESSATRPIRTSPCCSTKCRSCSSTPITCRSSAMVRASHTLCGIHRTGGIALIATTARALEQALLALEERGAPFPSTAQPILARATAGLAHFVARVKHREGFTPSDEREAADIERRARGDAPRCAGRHAGRRSADSAGERTRVRHAARNRRRRVFRHARRACRRARRRWPSTMATSPARCPLLRSLRRRRSPMPARCC